jgi:AcrR family transcriptional regulator
VRTKTASQAEKILKVAAELFATHRFHEARMEDIAAAAGVGKGTLYRYFKDKEALYTTLLERAADQMSERMHAGLDGVRGPRVRLEAAVRAIIEFFDAHPHLLDLIQHAEAMQRPRSRFPWQRARDENIALMRRLFDEAAAAGSFAVRDPDLTVLLLLGALRPVLRYGQRPRPADLPRRIVEIFLDGAALPAAHANGAGR